MYIKFEAFYAIVHADARQIPPTVDMTEQGTRSSLASSLSNSLMVIPLISIYTAR